MQAVSICCPSCQRRIDSFQITAEAAHRVKLRATCHPCCEILELVITCEDLAALAEGKEIESMRSSPPMSCETESPFHYRKRGKFWELKERDTLVAIVVYKKGAEELKARLDAALALESRFGALNRLADLLERRHGPG